MGNGNNVGKDAAGKKATKLNMDLEGLTYAPASLMTDLNK